MRSIAHEKWDHHFDQLAMKAFTRRYAVDLVNIVYFEVIQWR